MKITVMQAALSAALTDVTRAADRSAVLPVLQNVLLATDGGRLRLSATNLKWSLSMWVAATVEAEGAITLPAKTLLDLIASLPNDQVKLTLKPADLSVEIKCGGTKSTIKGITAEEFPPLPVVPDDAEGITLTAAAWMEAISHVAFAVSEEDARPIINGALFTGLGNKLTLVGTDGFRIAVQEQVLPAPLAKPVSAVIPGRGLAEFARLAKGLEDTNCKLVLTRDRAIFAAPDLVWSAQLIDGTFPAWEKIAPKSFKTRAVLPTKNFHQAIKQADIFAREGAHKIRLDLQDQGETRTMVIEGQADETGGTVSSVAYTGTGGLQISFNAKFLKDAVESFSSPHVVFETVGVHNAPARLSPMGIENQYCILMPML